MLFGWRRWSWNVQGLDGLVLTPLGRVGGHNLDHKVLGYGDVALAVKIDGAGDTLEILESADRIADGGARRLLVAGSLGRVLDSFQDDRGAVIGLGRKRLGVLSEAGLVIGGELGGFGV